MWVLLLKKSGTIRGASGADGVIFHNRSNILHTQNAIVEHLSCHGSFLLVLDTSATALLYWQALGIWCHSLKKRLQPVYLAFSEGEKFGFLQTFQHCKKDLSISLEDRLTCMTLSEFERWQSQPASPVHSMGRIFCHLSADRLKSDAFAILSFLLSEHHLKHATPVTFVVSGFSGIRSLAAATGVPEILAGSCTEMQSLKVEEWSSFAVPAGPSMSVSGVALPNPIVFREKCAAHVKACNSVFSSDSPLLSEEMAQEMRKNETHVQLGYALPLRDAQSGQHVRQPVRHTCFHCLKPECSFLPVGSVNRCLCVDPQPSDALLPSAHFCVQPGGGLASVATHADALLAGMLAMSPSDDSGRGEPCAKPWIPLVWWILSRVRQIKGYSASDVAKMLNNMPYSTFSMEDVQSVFHHLVEGHWLNAVNGEAPFTWSAELEHAMSDLPDFPALMDFFEGGESYLATFPNRTAIAYLRGELVKNEFCQRFSLFGCHYRRLLVFHNRCELTCRPVEEPGDWLSGGISIFDRVQAEKASEILVSSEFDDRYSLSRTGRQMLLEMRERCGHLRHYFPHCLEEAPDVVQWWTFAGATVNAALGSLLRTFLSDAEIKIGNFSIVVQKRGFRADVINAFVETFRNAGQWDSPEVRSAAGIRPELDARTFFYPFLPPDVAGSLKNERLNLARAYLGDLVLPLCVVPTNAITELSAPFQWKSAMETDNPSVTDDKNMEKQQKIHQNVQVSMSSGEVKPAAITTGPYVFKGLCGCGIRTMKNVGNRMVTHLPWFFIDQQRDFEAALNILFKVPYIGLDVETTLYKQSLSLVQIGYPEATFLIDPLALDISPLAQIFENHAIIKIIHNASFEKSVLGRNNIAIHNIIDTVTVSKKLRGRDAPGKHSLKAVCLREFGKEMDKTCQTSQWQNRPLSAAQLEYAALDAEILVHLYRKFFLSIDFKP